jgi:hypothetical protein
MTRNNSDFAAGLFHGSPHLLSPGDTILPGTALGKPKYYDNDKAWATTDADVAAEFADIRANRKWKPGTERNPAYVYSVLPLDGDDSITHVTDQKISSDKGFRVVKQVK